MKVYIVRHGEVHHNVLKLYNNSNEDLIDKGIMQALELRNKIKYIKFYFIAIFKRYTYRKYTNIL